MSIFRIIVHLILPGGGDDWQPTAVNMPDEQQARRFVVEDMVPKRFPGAIVDKQKCETMEHFRERRTAQKDEGK